MHKILFICFIVLLSFSSIDSLQLKNEFFRAKAGDYLVFEQDRLITLMLINSKTDALLTVEEITITEKKWNSLQKPKPINWKNWINNKAPKNNSWIIYELNLNTGNILRAYSYSNHCKVERSAEDNFLSTLLNLQFNKISLDDRKKIGIPPPSGEKDKRSLWNPPLIFEGQTIPYVKFEAFKARWPKDSSPLSHALIEMYLPIGLVDFPNYFPYWLQVSDQFTKAKLHIIDSGSNMQSAYSELPF